MFVLRHCGGAFMYIDEIVGTEKIDDLEEQIEVVIDVYDEIARFVESEDYETLNESQKFVYIVNEFFMELNNGGFSQYFFNEAGDHAIDNLEALEELGFFKEVVLLEKALTVFENGYIHDRFARQDYLMGESETEIETKLGELDKEFYEGGTEVDSMIYEYIYSNKDELEG